MPAQELEEEDAAAKTLRLKHSTRAARLHPLIVGGLVSFFSVGLLHFWDVSETITDAEDVLPAIGCVAIGTLFMLVHAILVPTDIDCRSTPATHMVLCAGPSLAVVHLCFSEWRAANLDRPACQLVRKVAIVLHSGNQLAKLVLTVVALYPPAPLFRRI